MSTAKHTPGPWIYDPQTSSVNTKIGTIVPMVPWKPNGPLIAAAPALADALEALLAAPDMPKAIDALNAERSAREKARAALRAAGRLP